MAKLSIIIATRDGNTEDRAEGFKVMSRMDGDISLENLLLLTLIFEKVANTTLEALKKSAFEQLSDISPIDNEEPVNENPAH